MARLSLLALAAFVAVAHAAAPAPAAGDGGLPGTQFSVKELARGEGAPANCSFESGGQMGANWVEMTQILNFTQYSSVPNSDLSGLPDPLPMPYSLTAEDTKALGWDATCFAQSPTAPADCSGDDCDVYLEEWGIKWLEFALLNCYGSYPTTGLINFFTEPTPPPGEVGVTVTETCKNYLYSSGSGSDLYYSVTDPFGTKWALQTVHKNITTEDEFDEWLAGVEWPAGFGEIEKVALNETGEIQEPFMAGGKCYSIVMKDNLFNSWHQYTYPEGGMTPENSMLGKMGSGCVTLNAQYTVEGMGSMAPTPAPAPAETSQATSAASAASASALLLAAAAVLALF